MGDYCVLTISSKNLNDDCTKVVPGAEVPAGPINAAEAVKRLQALAAIPAVELLEVEALVLLDNRTTQLAVQNVNGRLYSTRMPKTINSALEQTPAQIVDFLDGDPTRLDVTGQTDTKDHKIHPVKGLRAKLASPVLAVVLAVVALVMAYYVFSAEVPPGVEIIGDAAQVADLNNRFNGRYGDNAHAGQSVVMLHDGRLEVYTVAGNASLGELVLSSTYRYGLRGKQTVMVVANGAVLDFEEDGMRFNGLLYPRIPSR